MRIRIEIVSKCWCYDNVKQETMGYLFRTTPIAQQLLMYVAICAGEKIKAVNLMQAVRN